MALSVAMVIRFPKGSRNIIAFRSPTFSDMTASVLLGIPLKHFVTTAAKQLIEWPSTPRKDFHFEAIET
uniref:Transposase n=1 Tax=Ascaris lumbricoides TaxID=6252 RepID=A0A0M3ILN7_ASCLU